jgi:LPS export ABC transporter protein LptC
MPWRALIFTFLIAALLAAYGVLVRRPDQLVDTPAPAQSGYYLQHAIVTETDASGAAHLKLRADQIVQDPRDNSIDLQQVTLNYQSDADSHWLLTAHQGHVPAGSRVLHFSGAVLIKPQNPADNAPELHTEMLSVDTANNIATASSRVNLTMNQQRLTAIGLKYDLKRQTLKLESQVHGQFQAQ